MLKRIFCVSGQVPCTRQENYVWKISINNHQVVLANLFQDCNMYPRTPVKYSFGDTNQLITTYVIEFAYSGEIDGLRFSNHTFWCDVFLKTLKETQPFGMGCNICAARQSAFPSTKFNKLRNFSFDKFVYAPASLTGQIFKEDSEVSNVVLKNIERLASSVPTTDGQTESMHEHMSILRWKEGLLSSAVGSTAQNVNSWRECFCPKNDRCIQDPFASRVTHSVGLTRFFGQVKNSKLSAAIDDLLNQRTIQKSYFWGSTRFWHGKKNITQSSTWLN